MSNLSRSLMVIGRRLVAPATRSVKTPSMSLMQPRLTPMIVNRFASSAPSNKREKELAEFLVSEIQLEKDSTKSTLPKMDGWTVNSDGSDLTFFKKYNNEEITIKANVCYSVDAANPDADNGQMVCKPDFAIEIKKGQSILGLNCSFIQEEENMEESPNVDKLEDDFQINEISIYEGEFQKNNYAISGDVIDGNLYDMLMSILEDRGVDQEFAKNLIDYSTIYEHGQYVGLLENLNKFFSN